MTEAATFLSVVTGTKTELPRTTAGLTKCLAEKDATDIKAFIKKAFEDAVSECKYQSGN